MTLLKTGAACAEAEVRTLPFSCLFGAPKSGKWQQRRAQGEGGKSADSTRDEAQSDNARHTAAKGG
jgi:hypothetical protein